MRLISESHYNNLSQWDKPLWTPVYSPRGARAYRFWNDPFKATDVLDAFECNDVIEELNNEFNYVVEFMMVKLRGLLTVDLFEIEGYEDEWEFLYGAFEVALLTLDEIAQKHKPDHVGTDGSTLWDGTNFMLKHIVADYYELHYIGER